MQGSTDHALLYNILPGYIALPLAQWQTLGEFNKANTPVTALKNSANWWGNRPKYFASLLKGWFGDEATPENDFCYGCCPRGKRALIIPTCTSWTGCSTARSRAASFSASTP